MSVVIEAKKKTVIDSLIRQKEKLSLKRLEIEETIRQCEKENFLHCPIKELLR